MGGGLCTVGSNSPGWDTPTLLIIGMISPDLQPGAKKDNCREPADRRSVALFSPNFCFPVFFQ